MRSEIKERVIGNRQSCFDPLLERLLPVLARIALCPPVVALYLGLDIDEDAVDHQHCRIPPGPTRLHVLVRRRLVRSPQQRIKPSSRAAHPARLAAPGTFVSGEFCAHAASPAVDSSFTA